MKTKKVIREFLEQSPEQSPDGYLPLTLDNLPAALARLRAYEKRSAFVLVDHSMERLKEQAGLFLTDYLVKNGVDGARTLAKQIARAEKPKLGESLNEGVGRIGRGNFIEFLFRQGFHPDRLPTKAEFKEKTLWSYSCEWARKQLKKKSEPLSEQTILKLALDRFHDLENRYKEDKKSFRRILTKLGLKGLPHKHRGPKSKPK